MCTKKSELERLTRNGNPMNKNKRAAQKKQYNTILTRSICYFADFNTNYVKEPQSAF